MAVKDTTKEGFWTFLFRIATVKWMAINWYKLNTQAIEYPNQQQILPTAEVVDYDLVEFYHHWQKLRKEKNW